MPKNRFWTFWLRKYEWQLKSHTNVAITVKNQSTGEGENFLSPLQRNVYITQKLTCISGGIGEFKPHKRRSEFSTSFQTFLTYLVTSLLHCARRSKPVQGVRRWSPFVLRTLWKDCPYSSGTANVRSRNKTGPKFQKIWKTHFF